MFVTGVQGTSLRWSRFHRQRDALCIKADLERAFRWTKERAGCRFQAVEERWRGAEAGRVQQGSARGAFYALFHRRVRAIGADYHVRISGADLSL